MRRLAIAAVLLSTASCSDVTAAEIATAHVMLTPKQGSAACVIANPEPASVRVKQGVSFVNNSTVQITIVLTKDNLPLISVAPSDTSGAVKFREPGIYQYYSQACGSGSSELHTLAVTVN